MKTLGQYLREQRDEQDISLREFAQRLNLSATFVSDIELGKRHPSDQVLALMSKVLGVPLPELRRHDTRPPVEELKKVTAAKPGFAFAFRRVIDKASEDKLSPEELLNFVNKKSGGRSK